MVELRRGILLSTCRNFCEALPQLYMSQGEAEWRVVVDGRRTLQPIEIELLIKIHRKRSMGWLIALGEPAFNKPVKPKELTKSEPYNDYII